MASKQETYRRLMKEQKAKSGVAKKINHPLAKYNSLDQLTCVICNTIVKSEVLWKTHLLSKSHKENVESLKTSSSLTSKSTSGNDSEKFIKPDQPPKSRKRSHSNGELKDAPSTKKDKEESMETIQLQPERLPSDFFDIPPTEQPVVHSESNEEGIASSDSKEKDNNEKEEQKGDLPEGFFDDPKMDAKARKVEFKDPLDEQWEEFKKSISKESEKSEAIIEVDDTEMKEDRELSEIKEQVFCFERAEKLRLKQEALLASRDIKQEPKIEQLSTDSVKEEEDSSGDEADLSDLLNWRFKSS